MAALLLSLATACVGPTAAPDDYRIHAAVALENVHSAVAAADLATREAVAGRSTLALYSVLARESEENANHATSVFDSRQPPSPDADDIRSRVLPVLDEASSTLTELRIAAFRGDVTRAEEIASSLPELAVRSTELAHELRR